MISVSSINKNYTKNYKTFRPARCEMLEDIREIICGDYSWSPVLFDCNIRAEANFRQSNLVVLDIDDGLTLEDCIESVSNFRHIIGTTKSHQIPKGNKPACDRYRVIIAASSPCESLVDYKATLKYYSKLFGADRSATDGARYFFKCQDIISFSEFGDTIEWTKAKRKVPKYHRERIKGYVPPYVVDILMGRKLCRSGSRHHSIFYASAELSRHGFTVEQMQDRILNTPLGLDLLDFHNNNHQEVLRHVRNGFRKGQKEIG